MTTSPGTVGVSLSWEDISVIMVTMFNNIAVKYGGETFHDGFLF